LLEQKTGSCQGSQSASRDDSARNVDRPGFA